MRKALILLLIGLLIGAGQASAGTIIKAAASPCYGPFDWDGQADIDGVSGWSDSNDDTAWTVGADPSESADCPYYDASAGDKSSYISYSFTTFSEGLTIVKGRVLFTATSFLTTPASTAQTAYLVTLRNDACAGTAESNYVGVVRLTNRTNSPYSIRRVALIYRSDASWPLAGTTSLLPADIVANTWYTFEFHLQIASGADTADGYVKFYWNGGEITGAAVTGIDNGELTTPDCVWVGPAVTTNYNNDNLDFYFNDLEMCPE